MSHGAAEITSRPEYCSRELELNSEGLPRPGERVAVLGYGTSLYIAQAYAALREDAAQP